LDGWSNAVRQRQHEVKALGIGQVHQWLEVLWPNASRFLSQHMTARFERNSDRYGSAVSRERDQRQLGPDGVQHRPLVVECLQRQTRCERAGFLEHAARRFDQRYLSYSLASAEGVEILFQMSGRGIGDNSNPDRFCHGSSSDRDVLWPTDKCKDAESAKILFLVLPAAAKVQTNLIFRHRSGKVGLEQRSAPRPLDGGNDGTVSALSELPFHWRS
jgi:hypothetical protein